MKTGWVFTTRGRKRFLTMFSALGALLCYTTSGAQPAGIPGSAVDLGQGLFLGKALVVENVTAWPVYSIKEVANVSRDFVTLADAQEKKLAVVREKGAWPRDTAQPQGDAVPAQYRSRDRGQRRIRDRRSNRQAQVIQLAAPVDDEPHGTVNELVIENRGNKPILVLAGTLLKGGKQDRQVGQDFIVPPRKTVPVEAFCVEQGRWTARRDGEHTRGVFRAKKSLTVKGVRSSGQFKKDQGKVWERVASENRKAGKAPRSGTFMATVEETEKKAVARREKISRALSEDFIEKSKAAKAPVGFAYAVDGKVKEVRTFTHPLIFQRFFETLFSTVAMEADLAQREAAARKRPIYKKTADKKQVVDLVGGARRIKMKKTRTKAGSVIRERKSEKIWNADCYENDGDAEPATKSFMLAE